MKGVRWILILAWLWWRSNMCIYHLDDLFEFFTVVVVAVDTQTLNIGSVPEEGIWDRFTIEYKVSIYIPESCLLCYLLLFRSSSSSWRSYLWLGWHENKIISGSNCICVVNGLSHDYFPSCIFSKKLLVLGLVWLFNHILITCLSQHNLCFLSTIFWFSVYL